MNHPQTQAVWWWSPLYWIMGLFMSQETRIVFFSQKGNLPTALQTQQDVTYQINWNISVVLDPVKPFTQDSIIHLWHFSTEQTQEAYEQHAEINFKLSLCSPDHNPSPHKPYFIKEKDQIFSFFLSTQWYLLLRFSVSASVQVCPRACHQKGWFSEQHQQFLTEATVKGSKNIMSMCQ